MIGVYLGFNPSFTPSAATFESQSRMEGVEIRWHRMVPDYAEFKVGLETLHQVGRLTSHIWVLADDAQTLAELRQVAEGLSFSKRQ